MVNPEYTFEGNGLYLARVQGEVVGRLRVNAEKNYIGILVVAPGFRRHGVSIGLTAFAVSHRGHKFNRTPDSLKNALTKNFGTRHPELFVA